MSHKLLVTGSAGFIGFHLCKKLLERGTEVVGLDNLNSYYDPKLKSARLEHLTRFPNFTFHRMSLEDTEGLTSVFKNNSFEVVVNLAAQPGIRYSLENPSSYIQANLVGFGNILEQCRHAKVKHLIYASSSSVYGANRKIPFSEADPVDHPISLYAATKKANELMAHSYSHLFGLPTTGIRFFTVYGPWGRPDMAIFKFTKAILEENPIEIFNHGDVARDFTYIDDAVSGLLAMIDKPAVGLAQPDTSGAPHSVYNIGNQRPEKVLKVVELLERYTEKKATRIMKPLQPGEMLETCADVTRAHRDFGFVSKTPVEQGLSEFVTWYRGFYRN
ncbi:MAG: capsular biosynthesis protein CpsI [Bdellovibrionales bacterium RIFOXYC1_FULL_54_43]|nr:MAG: capsular biosynthesis protein CpsI [Bdellovibrionales bacterium RIFOXYC1_FULL_54_43]OFZ83969.1 MAG: capsular biosynthesis protein CpsI [Bdellovibrionales bacterium RIFOXYD1_FULL_55_31]